MTGSFDLYEVNSEGGIDSSEILFGFECDVFVFHTSNREIDVRCVAGVFYFSIQLVI